MDVKARVRAALTAAGHPLDPDIVEELAHHARAVYDAARAEGAGKAAADERVDKQVAIWCREAPQLHRRPRRVPAIPVPAGGTSRLVGVAHDVRYAARLLRRRPGATLVAMLTMALGIGATTVLFSVAWGVLFKPLPWPDADRLVRLSETREGSSRKLPQVLTNGTYLAWQQAPSTIEGLAGWSPRTATATGAGEPQRLRVAAVTPSLFPLLRAAPAIGAVFTEPDAAPGGATPLVLSHAFWVQQFAASPDALGRTIQLDGRPHTVVAVMPQAFQFPDRDTRGWVPFKVNPVVNDQSRFISVFSAIARLKPGASPAHVAAEATASGRAAPDPGLTAIAIFGSRGPVTVTALPMLQSMTADVREALIVFLAAVGLLLATATANVASVQLARSTARRREIAIRAAMGAGGGRIARQLLIENVLLGTLGGLLGLAGAFWLHRALPALLPADFPRAADVTLDSRVMAFAVATSVVASVAFGLLPALNARRVDLVRALTEDGLAPVGGSVRSATARARTLIMAGQVAVACVLLVGASLLMRSFIALLDADRGYDVTNVLTARVPLPSPSFTPQRRAALVATVLDRLGSAPGVTHAAFTTVVPLGPADAVMGFTLSPGAAGTAEPVQVQSGLRVVSRSYFGAMGIRLIDGRGFTAEDTRTSLPVVVVNRTFVRRYLTGPPLHRRLPAGLDHDKDIWEIVGVVDDVKMRNAIDAPQPEIFVSYEQLSDGIQTPDPTLVVRTSVDPAAFVPELRAIVRDEDASVALDAIVTMEQRLLGSLARPRLYAVLLGGFAFFALTIAAVGLFGVLSYSVAQRSREIAVRSALGARPWTIVRLVAGQGLAVTLAGTIAGMIASFALGRWISTFLYGVSVHDPLTFVGVPLALLLVAAVACFVPARRAATLDPLRALRG